MKRLSKPNWIYLRIALMADLFNYSEMDLNNGRIFTGKLIFSFIFFSSFDVLDHYDKGDDSIEH